MRGTNRTLVGKMGHERQKWDIRGQNGTKEAKWDITGQNGT